MGRYLTCLEFSLIERMFRKYLKPRLILDVGGGDGRFSRRLSKYVPETIILEYDSLPLYELQRAGWTRPLLRGDGKHIPCKDNSVDAVLAIEIPHCTNKRHNLQFFLETYRVLRREGLLIFTMHNAASPLGLLKRFEMRGRESDIYEFYSESYTCTKSKLELVGFTLLEARGFRWVPCSRSSQSTLVPLFAKLEMVLRLDRLVRVSPWVFCVAQK